MSESVTDEKIRRPRYWTLVREGFCHAEACTVDADGLGEALVVFGFEEEAELFLGLEELGPDWQVRETTAGELVSLLYGPYANISRVVIDPLPRRIAEGTGMPPLGVSSDDFASTMVDAGKVAAGAMPALATLRP
ncbi:hypothetical protein GBA65_01290 [Rubrobacter marinus]|uniref:Uncharacterized protein n=1 Tax=Rubrobacter marinus TaxID=2653852 RepID=A0A6G8PT42_9ACTN|nr:hypothetical protein [Rubrobacter marinus]QIN77367.1 hypothetical protein GBA65_01290 [Rubrobacter marinus]